ncbi:MAG: hypothetical protein LOY04_03965, partial [Rhodococcus ruber]|nr:hypothetical protein [Rhodococcus ruber]
GDEGGRDRAHRECRIGERALQHPGEHHRDVELDVDPGLSLSAAHSVAHEAEQALIAAVPHLTTALVHAYPPHETELHAT